MAGHTLPTLYATGNPTNFTSDWDANANTWDNINEPIGSPDGVEMGDDGNVPGDHFLYVTLTDMPSDFPVLAPSSTGAMDTLNFNIRYRVTGAQTNWRGLALQIWTDEVTPTALTNEYVLFGATSSSDRITNTTATNSGQLSFTGISLFSGKTTWDNAVLRLRLIVNKQMGGDTNGIRVDTFELNGTYYVGYTRTASLAGTATIAATGQKVDGAKQRSASLGGTATIAAAGFKVVARTASAAGVATITSAGLLVAQRTTSVAGTATITSTGVLIGVRSGSVSGAGTISVLGGKPTTLRPDADGTGWSNWTGAWTEIDDDPDSPTADFVRNTGGLDGTGWYRLSDSAADYDTGLEARVKVRAAGLDATSGVTLSARLYLSDQATPITDSVLVGTYSDTSESTVEVVMPWTSGTPPTKTQIDDAYLRLDVNVP